eukprot:TRINITY_DN3729_c0_g1_i1.p1 TRINITY_DN3729_c0_g1~~TRINITY_DN3729_c0_g1_i1.p1  ORF type:complete len:821 (-),score=192.33 TRINITY_DN3729_c0_g1_i1:68-2530(-)
MAHQPSLETLEVLCPICSNRFPPQEIENHANSCLDDQWRTEGNGNPVPLSPARLRQIEEDENFARRLSSDFDSVRLDDSVASTRSPMNGSFSTPVSQYHQQIPQQISTPLHSRNILSSPSFQNTPNTYRNDFIPPVAPNLPHNPPNTNPFMQHPGLPPQPQMLPPPPGMVYVMPGNQQGFRPMPLPMTPQPMPMVAQPMPMFQQQPYFVPSPGNYPGQYNYQPPQLVYAPPEQRFSAQYSQYNRLSQMPNNSPQSLHPVHQPVRPPVPNKPVPVPPSPKFERPADVKKEGYLWCSENVPNAFVQRYVLLQKTKLTICTNPSTKYDEFSLQGCTFSAEPPNFKIQTTSGKSYHFVSDLAELSNDWIAVFKKAVEQSNPNAREGRSSSLNSALSRAGSQLVQSLSGSSEGWLASALNSQEAMKKMDNSFVKELQAHPEEEKALIIGHLSVILTTSSHRFGKLIPKFVSSWLKKWKRYLKPKYVLDDQAFQPATEEIQTFVANLFSALDTFYKGLSTASPNARRLCETTAYELLFNQLYPSVFTFFKKRYREEDAKHDKKFKELLTISPAHLGIPERFWLLPRIPDDPDVEMSETALAPPYTKAINCLQKLPLCVTSEAKTNCLVETAKIIVESVKEYYEETDMESSKVVVGGDELLPLFSYVLLKSGVQNMFSEVSFMEVFLNDSTAIEQGGYLIATFQTALSFLCCLEKSQMEQSASEIMQKVKREPAHAVPSSPMKERQRPTDVSLEQLEALLNEPILEDKKVHESPKREKKTAPDGDWMSSLSTSITSTSSSSSSTSASPAKLSSSSDLSASSDLISFD